MGLYVENRDPALGGDAGPCNPKLAAPARAVASNLNSHFLFYFEILSGILGMLRRASRKAPSTEWSCWLEAGVPEWKQITCQDCPSDLRTNQEGLREQGEERPAGRGDGQMQAGEM